MSPEEKMILKEELAKAIHVHSETTGQGLWSERTIIEPQSLKAVLDCIIDAISTDEV